MQLELLGYIRFRDTEISAACLNGSFTRTENLQASALIRKTSDTRSIMEVISEKYRVRVKYPILMRLCQFYVEGLSVLTQVVDGFHINPANGRN